ncbi:MAG: methylmalonyl-CoA mutase family protein [Flavobacteriales bacterium]
MSQQDTSLPFEPLSYDDWRALAEKELKGKSFDEFLKWNNISGLELESWQQTRPAQNTSLPALTEPWKIVEPVFETDAIAANRRALDALMAGAEAIWFEKSFHGAAAKVACANIDQAIAPTLINQSTHSDVYKPLLKSSAESLLPSNNGIQLNGVRLRERGANIIQEVAFLIAQGIEQLNSTKNHRILFRTGIGTSYIAELCKVRALRLLWSRVLSASGNSAENPIILAQNLCIDYSRNDEHTNILRAVSSAMAAVSGGVQFVMIQPWDRHWKDLNGFSSRISRNIQVLLKEESKMDKNLNPADGSYFLENLTLQMANEAWTLVQEVESVGGFTVYAKSGKLKAAMDKERNKLIDAYSDKKVLLGVNKYRPSEIREDVAPNVSKYDLLPNYVFIPTDIKSFSA